MKKQTVEKHFSAEHVDSSKKSNTAEDLFDSTEQDSLPRLKLFHSSFLCFLSTRTSSHWECGNVLVFLSFVGYLNLVVQKKRIAAAVGEESKERRCMRNSCCLFRLCVGSSEGDGDAGERHGWSGAREVASRRE
jgi:hypothetical protein